MYCMWYSGVARGGCKKIEVFENMRSSQFAQAWGGKGEQRGRRGGTGHSSLGSLQCDAALFGTLDAHTHSVVTATSTASWARLGTGSQQWKSFMAHTHTHTH